MMDAATAKAADLAKKREPVSDFISIDGPAVAGLPRSVTFKNTPVAVSSFLSKDRATEGDKEAQRAITAERNARPKQYTTATALKVTEEERKKQLQQLHDTAQEIREEQARDLGEATKRRGREGRKGKGRGKGKGRSKGKGKASELQSVDILGIVEDGGKGTGLGSHVVGTDRSARIPTEGPRGGTDRSKQTADQAVSDARQLLCGCIRSIALQCAVVQRMYSKVLTKGSATDGIPDMHGINYDALKSGAPEAQRGAGTSRVDSGLSDGVVTIKRARPKSAPSRRLLPPRSASSPALRTPLVQHIRPPYNAGYNRDVGARSHNLNFSSSWDRSAPVLSVSVDASANATSTSTRKGKGRPKGKGLGMSKGGASRTDQVLTGSLYPVHPVVEAAVRDRQLKADVVRNFETLPPTRAKPASDTPYLSGRVEPYQRFDFKKALTGFVPTLALEPPSPYLARALKSTGKLRMRPVSAPLSRTSTSKHEMGNFVGREEKALTRVASARLRNNVVTGDVGQVYERDHEEPHEDLYADDLFDLSADDVDVRVEDADDYGDDDLERDGGGALNNEHLRRGESLLSIKEDLRKVQSVASMGLGAILDQGNDDMYDDDGFEVEEGGEDGDHRKEEEEGAEVDGGTFALTATGVAVSARPETEPDTAPNPEPVHPKPRPGKKRSRKGGRKRRGHRVAALRAAAEAMRDPGPLSDAPCIGCRKFYRGPGKMLPEIVTLDREMRRMCKDVAVSFDATGRMSPEKDMRKRMQVERDTYTGVTHQWRKFCSWRCIREWNQETAPVQYRYRNDILIEIAASADQDFDVLREVTAW